MKTKFKLSDIESNYFANHFLKTHDIEDICEEIEGELNEFSDEVASYWYGNGELIAYPHDPIFEGMGAVYVVDQIGFDKTISLYDVTEG